MPTSTEDKINALRAAGLLEVDDPNLLIDNIKEPVKISASFFDEENGEVNTIWAEKADYLNEDNLGEGFENTPEFAKDSTGAYVKSERTFKLNMKQATQTSIGGIKLPVNGALSFDANGNIEVNFDNLKQNATFEKTGVIKPGTGVLYDPLSGSLSVDPYVLPTATNTIKGGVKISPTVENEDGIVSTNIHMYKDEIIRVFSDVIRNSSLVNLTPSQKEQAGDRLTSLDFILELLLEQINASNLLIEALKDRVKVYVDGMAVEHGSIISGEGTFNGEYTGGADKKGCVIKFGTPLNSENYHVALCQFSSTLGDLGEVSILQKTVDGFIVSNTGGNTFDTFVWFVVPADVKYSETIIYPDNEDDYINSGSGLPIARVLKDLPIKRGTSKFEGINGVAIALDGDVKINRGGTIITSPDVANGNGLTSFKNANYIVIVTPTTLIESDGIEQPTDGYIGEYWVEGKTNSSFIVKNTGTKKGITFDWIAIPYTTESDELVENSGLNYDRVFFPIRCGSISTTDAHMEVQFEDTVYDNKLFLVFSQLASQTNGEVGRMGEYCVDETTKTRSGFEIKRSGSATEFTVDWLTIDKSK